VLIKVCPRHWIEAEYIVEVVQKAIEKYPVIATINGEFIQATNYENAEDLIAIIREATTPRMRTKRVTEAREMPGKPASRTGGGTVGDAVVF
jgi:hypothetical protein